MMLQGSFGADLEVIYQVIILIIISALSGSLVYVLKGWYDNKLEREQKLEDIAITLYGVEGVNTVEGLVDIMESHDRTLDSQQEKIEDLSDQEEDIEEIYGRLGDIENNVQENAKKIADIRERVKNLAERCRERDPKFGNK